MTLYQPIKESVQLVTTPTNSPKSVLMNSKTTTFEEFMKNIHNMSRFRLILFVISILLCFAVIIVVLFIIPCEWSNCISSRSFKFKDKFLQTEYIFTDMELKGKPSVIELNHKRLVFIVRGPILNSVNVAPRTEQFPLFGGGLLQIDMTGKKMWCKHVSPLPDKIDCTLLNNQLKENDEVYCIVGASNGNLLGVVSSSINKGEIIWKQTKNRLESNTTKLYKNDLVYMEFPVIIPDCDSDSINEMAIVQHKNNKSTLDIVSGKSGKSMINSFVNNNCTKMTDLFLNYDMSLVYSCRKTSGTDPLETVPIKSMLNCSENWIPNSVHQTKREHDQIEENQYSLELGYYHLNIFNNHYNCPTKCKVVMNVTNSSGGTVWSKNIDRSYVMKPVTFELRKNISGFLIKIWSWDNETSVNKITFPNINRIGHIQEQVLAIMYNSSRAEDFHVKIISSNTILQVCENETRCQPKLEYQKHSLNLIDIDNDGYMELISVLATFKPINAFSKFPMNDKKSLQLISKVNVFQLEENLIQEFEN